MAETIQEYNFTHKEIVEALIKKQGLHEGIWMLNIRFGIGAINAKDPDRPSEAVPAAVVPITGIGLRKVDSLSPLALDAAEVNPAQGEKQKKPKKASEFLTDTNVS